MRGTKAQYEQARFVASGSKRHWRTIVVLCLSLALVSCAWVSVYVPAPGVRIQTLPSPRAKIVSAHFWRDGEQISLRGAVVKFPSGKSPLRGHVDMGITYLGALESHCLITRPRLNPREVRKRFSVALDALPPPGSTVKLWHHYASRHDFRESTPGCLATATT